MFLSGDLLHRQLLSKQRLSIELENDKKRLQFIQRELQVFQAQLPPGSSQRLAEEIERLRLNCKQMSQEVEEAGPGYGKINDSIHHHSHRFQRIFDQIFQLSAKQMQHFIETFTRVNGYRDLHVLRRRRRRHYTKTIACRMKTVYHGPVTCAHSRTIPYLINANSVKCRY